jgi:hypothetical protein
LVPVRAWSNEMTPAFFSDFELDQRNLCRRLQVFVQTLPPSLRDAVLAWPRARGIAEERLAWNSIYFFVPFWAQSELGRPTSAECLEVAYANACLTYAVLVQDELMDEQGAASGECAMAANVLNLEAHLAYSALFPSDSVFWTYFTPLLRHSWDCLLVEKRRQLDPCAALRDHDDELQISKVNWMKAAAIAVALLNGRPEAIPNFSGHVDSWQLACQKIDDLLDWRGDLGAGNYTYLLALAGVTDRNDEHRMQEFFGSGAVGPYLDGALRDYRAAQSHCLDPQGHLFRHIADLIERLSSLQRTYGAFAAQARTLACEPAATAGGTAEMIHPDFGGACASPAPRSMFPRPGAN